MQSFVTILQVAENSIKCIVSNLSNEEIIEAHEKVYGLKVIVLENLKVYNTKIFLEYLDKLSQFRVSFVTVSFDNEYQNSHIENKLPFRHYCHSQKDLILELVETTNKLCAIVSSGLDSFTRTNLKVKHESPLTKIFIMKPKAIFQSDPCIEQYLSFVNDNFYYEPKEILHLFPEFQITCLDFPKDPLAMNMFHYKMSKGYPSIQVVSDVNTFFGTVSDTDDTDNTDKPPPHFLQISEINDSITTDRQRKQIIQKFLDLYTEERTGEKIQSTILYETFVNRMGIEGKQVSQTKFGIIIKGILQSNRANSCVYFLNIKFRTK